MNTTSIYNIYNTKKTIPQPLLGVEIMSCYESSVLTVTLHCLCINFLVRSRPPPSSLSWLITHPIFTFYFTLQFNLKLKPLFFFSDVQKLITLYYAAAFWFPQNLSFRTSKGLIWILVCLVGSLIFTYLLISKSRGSFWQSQQGTTLKSIQNNPYKIISEALLSCGWVRIRISQVGIWISSSWRSFSAMGVVCPVLDVLIIHQWHVPGNEYFLIYS